VTGRTTATLEYAVRTIRAAGGTAEAAVFDIADLGAQRAVMAEIDKIHGRLDILINNVGARDRRPLAEFADAAVLELLRT
ncbi:SDR family NAD(P)-dependent oxidoreductase, partial [Rhizobium ruizarguesonis]